MRFWTILACLLGVASAVPAPAANQSNISQPKCQNPIVRKEWRSLSTSQQKAYIAAVQCLMHKPSKTDKTIVPGARTRFDDFNAVHITSSYGLLTGTGGIHMVGFFLQWHRLFVWVYEKALREECGYDGAQPYWDWSIDADSGVNITQWDIYNPSCGFGGNGDYIADQNATVSWPIVPGQTGGGCVKDGPFKDIVLNVGPGQSLTYNPHCLHRGLNPNTIPWLKSERVALAMAADTYLDFDIVVQGPQNLNPANSIMIFHTSGHYVQGGDSTDFISSNAEPIFYLHHAHIDKIYWDWQMMNPSVRLTEIGGVRIPFHPESANVTLDDTLNMQWSFPTTKIEEVMHIQKGVLCYDYE